MSFLSPQPLLSRFVRRLSRARGVRLDDFRPAEAFDTDERARLGPVLYAIFCHSYGALSAEVVLDEIVFKAGGYLGLYHDRAGQLVGFATIKPEAVIVDGRRCTSLAAGAYFLPGQRGGQAAGRLGLGFALAMKLRHPLRPLVYGFELLSPISYLRGTKIFAEFYPSRTLKTPPLMAAIAEATISSRGLLRTASRPLVVRYDDPATHERSVPTALVSEDPEVRFYLDQNPHYADGDILFAVAPMTLRNLIASSTTTTTAWLRAGLGRRQALSNPTTTTTALTRQTGE